MLLDGTSEGSPPARSAPSDAAPKSTSRAAPGSAGPRSYPLYIAGKDVDGDGWVYTISGRALLEDVFTSVSLKRSLERQPDSPEANHPYVVGRCAIASGDMIDLASESAAAAAPGWAALPLDHRMRLGTRFREELVRRQDEFIDMLTAEAHPAKLARWELSCLLQIYSEESLGWYRQQMHSEFQHAGRRLIVRRQPDGVVAFNPPQNAPLPSAALGVLCLMAGNAVVMRAPRSIALSTMWLMRDVVAPLLDELGAPPGTLNAVCSNPKQTMDKWVDSPLIDDIFYIGDSEQGLLLEQKCVANGKKPILELAGNDGIVVWHDADVRLAAQAVTEAFYGSGQICMVPNYVLVHPRVADELLAAVKEQVALIRPGYPEDEDVLLSPVRRSERFFRLLRQATDNGAEVVTGGRRSAYPQARAVALAECGTHAVFAAEVAPLAVHETVLARRLFPSLTRGMLLLADRGFLGFDLWRAAAATGADLLWRVKSNAVLPMVTALPDGSYLSEIVAARDKNRRADPAPVRVIEYTLGPRGESTVYRLVTTLLDPATAPATELAALYAERWEIETTLDEIKTHLGGPRFVLRSRHPAGVEQEIFAFLLVHHALRDLMHQAAQLEREDPDRMSFTRTLRVVRRQTTSQAGLSPLPAHQGAGADPA